MDMSLSKVWEMVKNREACCTAASGIAKSWTRLSHRTRMSPISARSVLSRRKNSTWNGPILEGVSDSPDGSTSGDHIPQSLWDAHCQSSELAKTEGMGTKVPGEESGYSRWRAEGRATHLTERRKHIPFPRQLRTKPEAISLQPRTQGPWEPWETSSKARNWNSYVPFPSFTLTLGEYPLPLAPTPRLKWNLKTSVSMCPAHVLPSWFLSAPWR